MISGIYQSAAGMDSLIHIQEVIANNLANINTNGFKKEMLEVLQVNGTQLQVQGTLNTSPGAPKITDSPYHMTLGSEGYFTVDTGAGIAYTRNGDFSINREGQLVTAEGHLVQGKNGPIIIESADFTVTETGDVVSKGQIIDALLISCGTGPMQRLGNSLMVYHDTTSVVAMEAENVQVMQGVLEGSNVNVVECMTDLILVTRLFEANQKALESQDGALQQLISQVGRAK
ncbi:flagellar hook-basal body protein [bacterium]|nr:flagellar hook-basal body protein [bacterium]